MNGSTPSKLDAMLFLQDMITSENEDNQNVLKAKASSLIEALQVLIKNTFDKPRSEVTVKFIIFILNSIHKICTISLIMKVISPIFSCHTLEFEPSCPQLPYRRTDHTAIG